MRARWVVVHVAVCFLSTALLAACLPADPGPSDAGTSADAKPSYSVSAATRQGAITACKNRREVLCKRYEECLGPANPASACLAKAAKDNGTCESEMADDCKAMNGPAFQECADRDAKKTCAELCSTSGAFTFCYGNCFYFCP